jgi:hypothetical protein
MRMIDRVKQRVVEVGFEACLDRKPVSQTKPKKANGDMEAYLIALSCSKAPEGFSRWSLSLLADKMVEMEYVESISHETIRRVLKKRVEATEGSRLDYSTPSKQPFCCEYGTSAGCL